MKKICLTTLLLALFIQINAGFYAGVARKVITPDSAIWLSGYASRTRPSDGILHDLWAKALVIGENKNIGIIIVTIDVIGLSHELSENISRRVIGKYGIDRSRLLLNTSHTHSAPVIFPSLIGMYELSKRELQDVVRFSRLLEDAVVGVIDIAFQDMKPANLYIAHGSADIAINRRQSTNKGVAIGVNKEGPTDSDVPVLKVASPEGKIRAVLFGYACHNTTLDIYQVNGDYAGFAQIEIENANPGVTAMFLEGCGADQNPNPRRSVELAMQHGKTLAGAVQKVLSGDFKPVGTPVRTFFTSATLEFAPFDPEQFREEILGDNKYKRRRACFILEAIDKGYDVSKISYPVQAVRFGKDFAILALGGEVVVDYSLKTKDRYSGENVFVAGYSTEVQCYIPSVRVLKEGGYEPEDSMIYYGLPGPFADNVEEKIFATIDLVMKRTGARPSKKHLNTK